MAQHRPNMPHNRANTGPIWTQHRPHVAQHGPSTAKHRANMGPTYNQHTPNMSPTKPNIWFYWNFGANTPVRAVVVAKQPEYTKYIKIHQNTSKYHTIQIQRSFPSSFSEVLDISHSHPTRAE